MKQLFTEGESMFGMYEIDVDNNKYWGNVALKEIHKFNNENGIFILDIDSMECRAISKEISGIVDQVFISFGQLVPEASVDALRKLSLVCEDNEATGAAGGWPVDRPVASLALFVSQECNMRCVYCYGGGGSYGEGGKLNVTNATGAVDWFLENSDGLDKVNIHFFGGEPLMNFEMIRSVITYAKVQAAKLNKKITFGLTTNGSILTDEILSLIKKEQIRILVSFDGVSEIQNNHRPFKNGKGSFNRVLKNLGKLKSACGDIAGRATIFGGAVPANIKNGMRKAGIKNCFVVEASPILNAPDTLKQGGCSNKDFPMNDFALGEVDDLMHQIKQRAIERGNLSHFFAALVSREKRRYACGVGKGMVAISVSGGIYPCHRFVGHESARLGSIGDIASEARAEYYEADVDNLEQCKSCWARYFCGGGCFYDNLSCGGNMRVAPESFCSRTKSTLEKLISMWCQLDSDDQLYCRTEMKGGRL